MAGIAGGTALAGRAVAGDSFKNKNEPSAADKRATFVASRTNETASVNQFQRRAHGGDVAAGRPYLVGDKYGMDRAEVFVPNQAGHIFPSVDAYQRKYQFFGGPHSGVALKEDVANQLMCRLDGHFSRMDNHFSRLELGDHDNNFIRLSKKHSRSLSDSMLDAFDVNADLSRKMGRRLS